MAAQSMTRSGVGTRPPATRTEPAQEGGVGHVGTHQADAPDDLGQVEVGGADDLHALDVDELVVEHVLGQQHLAGAAHDVAQVEARRAQQHLGVPDAVDGGRRHEGQTAPDPDDEPAHRRVDLPVGPARHDVIEAADLLTGLVADRATEHAGQRHDGVEDALGREDAAGAAAALVRVPIRVTGSAREQARRVGRAGRRWRGHGATSCGSSERIAV